MKSNLILDKNFLESVRNYNGNRDKNWITHSNEVRYQILDWVRGSRVLLVELKNEINVVYLLDYSLWYERVCGCAGFFASAVYIVVIVGLLFSPVFIMEKLSEPLQTALFLVWMLLGIMAPVFSLLTSLKIDQFVTTKIYLFVDNQFKKEPIILESTNLSELVKNEKRCQYLDWLTEKIHNDLSVLGKLLDESNSLLGMIGARERLVMRN